MPPQVRNINGSDKLWASLPLLPSSLVLISPFKPIASKLVGCIMLQENASGYINLSDTVTRLIGFKHF